MRISTPSANNPARKSRTRSSSRPEQGASSASCSAKSYAGLRSWVTWSGGPAPVRRGHRVHARRQRGDGRADRAHRPGPAAARHAFRRVDGGRGARTSRRLGRDLRRARATLRRRGPSNAAGVRSGRARGRETQCRTRSAGPIAPPRRRARGDRALADGREGSLASGPPLRTRRARRGSLRRLPGATRAGPRRRARQGIPADRMTGSREQALAPLSRVDAERLLPELSSGRQTLERRVLRARCLKYLESFDLAWAELSAVLPLVKDPLLAARVAVDLLHLSYYLVRREDSVRFAAMAESSAAGDPLLLAELRLGSSIVRTASNDVRGALVDARRGSDALAVAPRGRSRDLVTTSLQRQLAH